jgi:hypothetical protein
MTSPLTPEQQQRVDLHANDVKHIDELLKSEAYRKYFMRRIHEKRSAALNRLLNDEPRQCDPLMREGLRQSVLVYDGILSMLDTDKKQSLETLTQLVG